METTTGPEGLGNAVGMAAAERYNRPGFEIMNTSRSAPSGCSAGPAAFPPAESGRPRSKEDDHRGRM